MLLFVSDASSSSLALELCVALLVALWLLCRAARNGTRRAVDEVDDGDDAVAEGEFNLGAFPEREYDDSSSASSWRR